MDFDDIVVKESPGLCRCCLSEGCYKDLSTEYQWMDDTEIYADMLLDCFDISISQHAEGPNGANRLICEVCVTRLRDACNFKKQVLASEKKFVDMVGRGAFKPKAVTYNVPIKSEAILEIQPQETEVEFLEAGMDYPDDDVLKDDLGHTSTDDITVSTLPIKGKKGKAKKTMTKAEKKSCSKIVLVEKPKISKPLTKGIKIESEVQETYIERLHKVRKNIILLLKYGNILPFHWNTKGFKCFYCNKYMKDCDVLKKHTKSHVINLDNFIPKRIITKDIPVKIDVTELSCKMCSKSINTIQDLINHINSEHEQKYDDTITCVLPFVLKKTNMKCVLCDSIYDNFNCILNHMFKNHMEHDFICQICGLTFINGVRLKRHINNSHNGYKCQICSKIFDAFHKMLKHKHRIHGVVRSHVCNLCSTRFDTLYKMNVHMGNVHNVEKYLIKCSYCDKVCNTKGAMLLHVQSLHPSIKYQCDICDYTSGIRWMIKLHKRKHFDEKNYMCSICERRFGRSSNLRAHMKVHSGKFGRVCRWCRRGFIDFDTLNAHEKELHYYELYK
ncbi:PREDICTED: zinc finger protein 181-like isoform X8 [Papilio xuthus]|uniref:Zinc finger protein 181-like isoform X8 n=1 Tax=Papilio xuthus TaxID=66420 RepID=A0AAJ6Z3H1_PAPXU|nr:PREDICTED: zinc finger protein 181-like isoform X8 [Papilio xuthus]